MDNNKLGLKIVRIKQGYSDLLEINGDQIWTKNIWDIRKDLENIDNLDGSSAVLMLTSVDTGHILTISSLIEGRSTDCISAWIHVPASINIAGKELVEIVEVVKKEILANERNDDRLTQLLSKSYESAPATKITTKCNGEKCAYRYYGQGKTYVLSELLDNMYQSYYKDYKCIFLLDNSSNLRCLQGDNLSDQKVYSMVVVESPGNKDSFVPYIGEKPFIGQMYAVEGDVIVIEWRRKGYQLITTETVVGRNIKIKWSLPSQNQYMRVIPYETIRVVDERKQPMHKYHMYLENKEIRHGSSITINESIIRNVFIKINAEGFEPFEGKRDLSLSQGITIELVKETYAYEFQLPLKNKKEYYPITISSDRKMNSSPVKGYVTENGHVTRHDKNRLQFQPFTRKFWIISLICSIIVLLLGFSGGYAIRHYIEGKADKEKINKLIEENNKLKKEIKELKNLDSIEIDNQTILAAISYLDSHSVWNRTEMEKFVAIQGLWDALNEREFEKILHYEKELKKSKIFSKLVKAIKTTQRSFSAPYCDEGDTEITISIYMSKLGPNVQQQDKNQKSSPGQNDW